MGNLWQFPPTKQNPGGPDRPKSDNNTLSQLGTLHTYNHTAQCTLHTTQATAPTKQNPGGPDRHKSDNNTVLLKQIMQYCAQPHKSIDNTVLCTHHCKTIPNSSSSVLCLVE